MSCIDPTINAISSAGQSKTKQSFLVNLLTGWNAGVFIAIGATLATIVSQKVSSDWGGFMFAAVFPIGLIGIIFMGGADLFTGDCMITPMATCTRKSKIGELYRNWFLALGGNLIGSICWAWIIALSLIYGTSISAGSAAKAIAIAEGKIALMSADFVGGFLTMVFKGIICNLLVNFAIYQGIKSNSNLMAKVFNIWFPIMAFVAVGSEHVIANMFFIPIGIFSGANVTWTQAFIYNFLPVLTGNMIGGYVFMGLNYWFSTGTHDVDDPEGTVHSDARKVGRVLKQFIPLIIGWVILSLVYIIIPAGIAMFLENGIIGSAGFARMSFMDTPMLGNVTVDLVVPIVIIVYVILISIVLRITFRKTLVRI
ncbi:MAG: formate/nitrite transporter family protein [Candidatus Lokiarchaeota archaeon]|nr:formate/nitrite transporter family protein [Candidatus Lokiarchaeota archaeon]